MTHPSWLAAIKFNEQGLIPTIVIDHETCELLMVAWMNDAALLETVANGYAVYWSRSRKRLWRKGEASGHLQEVKALRLDCDGDVLTLSVNQVGGIACHTGRRSCFFRELRGEQWLILDPVLKSPEEIYD